MQVRTWRYKRVIIAKLCFVTTETAYLFCTVASEQNTKSHVSGSGRCTSSGTSQWPFSQKGKAIDRNRNKHHSILKSNRMNIVTSTCTSDIDLGVAVHLCLCLCGWVICGGETSADSNEGDLLTSIMNPGLLSRTHNTARL